MFIHNLNPTLLKIGIFEIRYYGLVYVFGFILVIWWMHYLRKKGILTIDKDTIWDFTFYLLLGVLIGSRLGMLVWQPKFYLLNPIEIFKIWTGGMSFHGGLVGITIAGWWYCRKKRIPFLKMADVLSIPAMFALALGRVANFINGELWGRITNVSWCVKFPSAEGCRHPSQLYASGKRFIIFFWLAFLMLKKELKPGFIFFNFILFEGLGRIIVDFFREDVLYYGFSLGQWMSLIMVIFAAWILTKYYKNDINNLLGKR